MTFQELNLLPQLLQAVDDMGYQAPSPIQAAAIPPVRDGRDLIGCAQTGTGKTAAFAIPILQRLSGRINKTHQPIRALVLTPTRELALQIKENFDSYGKYLSIRNTVIFGGVGQGPQVEALEKGVDVLVATPGRLNDLCNQGHIDLSGIEVFVLDEADRMLDMGFIHDVKRVIARLPKKRQTLLFSATMPQEIAELSKTILVDPVRVEVTPQSSTVEAIEQRLYKVDKANKKHLLQHILQDASLDSVLVFTNTKHGADRVVKELGRSGLAISFCNFDELAYLKDIEKLIGKKVPVVEDHPWPMEIFEATPKVPRPPRAERQKAAGTGTVTSLPKQSAPEKVPAPATKKPVPSKKSQVTDRHMSGKQQPPAVDMPLPLPEVSAPQPQKIRRLTSDPRPLGRLMAAADGRRRRQSSRGK